MRFARTLVSLVLLLSAVAQAAPPPEFHFFRGMNYYEFLGVENSADGVQIKRAFRKTMMRFHTDRGGSTEAAQFANEAYEILKDNNQRRAFDEWLLSAPERRRSRADVLAAIVTEVERMRNPSAAQARAVIQHYAFLFSDKQIHVSELLQLAGQLPALSEASIGLLKERALYPGFDDFEEARRALGRIGEGPKPATGVSACEAALRYREAAELMDEIPVKIDLRF